MPALDKDLEVTARDSKDFTVIALGKNRQPFNISTFQALFVVKQNRIDKIVTAKIIKKTSGLVGGSAAQITIVDAAKGILEIHLSSSDTTLELGVYRYSVILVKASTNQRFTIARGTFQVLEAEVDEEIL